MLGPCWLSLLAALALDGLLLDFLLHEHNRLSWVKAPLLGFSELQHVGPLPTLQPTCWWARLACCRLTTGYPRLRQLWGHLDSVSLNHVTHGQLLGAVNMWHPSPNDGKRLTLTWPSLVTCFLLCSSSAWPSPYDFVSLFSTLCSQFEPVVLNGGWFCLPLPTPGDIWQRLEIFLVVVTWREVLLASAGWRTGLVHTLQGTEHPPTGVIIQPNMSPGLDWEALP